MKSFVGKTVSSLHTCVRTRPIANALGPFLTNEKTLLDIGCFDGSLAHRLASKNNLRAEGVDVSLPHYVKIPAKLFDGENLPYKKNSVDCCLLVDVLHHASNPEKILSEAKRVSSKSVLIKDIFTLGQLDNLSARLVDTPSLALFGERPKKYFSLREWREMAAKSGMEIEKTDLSFKLSLLDPERHIILKLTKCTH